MFSILCSASGVIFLSWMSFQEILEFLNFLYAVGMLFEFAAFIKLRIDKPEMSRPYKVPLDTIGAAMLCLPPVFLLVLVMCLASLQTFIVSGAVILLGFASYPVLMHAKEQNWIKFNTDTTTTLSPSSSDDEHREHADEESHNLLADFPSSRTGHASDVISSEGDTKFE